MTIRPFRMDDIAAVTSFLHGHGVGVPHSEDGMQLFWRARWDENPAVKALGKEACRGWVVEDNNAIVGFAENIPRTGVIGDQQVAISTLGLSAVDNDHPDAVDLLASAFLAQDATIYMGGSETAVGNAIKARTDHADVTPPDLDQVLYWIVDAAGYLKTEELKNGRGKFAAWAMGLLRSVALDFTMRLGGRRPYGSLKNIKPMPPSAIDETFDAFWTKWRGECADTLIAARDAAALRWRFGAGCSPESTRVLRYDDDAGLRGYLVLVRDDAPEIDLRCMRIADFVVLDNDEKVATSLFASAYEYATAKRCQVVELVGLPPDARALALKHKPYDRPVKHEYFVKGSSDTDDYYLTSFDFDVGLP